MTTLPLTTRLGYELLWLSRMLARRDDLFFDVEMRLEEAIGETIGCALRVVAEGGFKHFLVLDRFLLATSFLNPAMLKSNIHMTLNHFLGERRREKLYINDTGPRLTVPIKGRKGPSYVEVRKARLGDTETAT